MQQMISLTICNFIHLIKKHTSTLSQKQLLYRKGYIIKHVFFYYRDNQQNGYQTYEN